MTADPRQIPTLPVLVEITLTTGHTAHVTLFLSITSQHREGPETLDEFFNTPRRLLPVAEGEKRALVTRDAIISARVMSEISPSSDSTFASGVDMIRAELTNGKVVDGAVKHANETRVSDFFNAAPDFFAVEDAGGIVYVNKRHVVSISM